MSMIGGGKIGYSNISKTIRLNDTAGNDSFTIVDGDGVPLYKLLSNGIIKTKVSRIQRL